MVEWVIEGHLARSSRPGFGGPGRRTRQAEVDTWLSTLCEWGIRSIVCILDHEQLNYSFDLPGGLIDYYRIAGFEVVHIPAEDFLWPPLSPEQLEQVWAAYQGLPKPVLIHCNAGISRTGAAVEFVQEKLRDGRRKP